jgi:hypothetical protein
LNLILEFLLKALEAFSVFIHRPDIFLKDALLRGCGTDDLGEPAQVGWVPIGPAGVPDIVPEQEGLASQLGRFKIADGIFTCPGEIANGCIFPVGT